MRTIEVVCPICGTVVNTLRAPGTCKGRIVDPFSVCETCQRHRPYDIVVVNEDDYEFIVAHRGTVECMGGEISRGHCVVSRERFERIRESTYS